MKNIWIFNHYATDGSGPKPRAYDMGIQLIKRGHKVTVFASSFNHYKLKEEHLGKKEKYKEKSYNGVNFIWIKTFPYKKNNWRRALNMLSFAWRAYFISKKKNEKLGEMKKFRSNRPQYSNLEIIRNVADSKGHFFRKDFIKEMKKIGYKSPSCYLWRFVNSGFIKRIKKGYYKILF